MKHGDKSSNRILKFGDHITLRSSEWDGHLCCTGKNYNGVQVHTLVEGLYVPPNVSECRFELVQKQHCAARKAFQKELSRLGLEYQGNWRRQARPEDVAVLSRCEAAEEGEQRLNEMEYLRSVGTYVRYGQIVQLKSVPTGRFLTVQKEKALSEQQCIKLELVATFDDSSYFYIEAGYKRKAHRDYLMFGDTVAFMSAKFPNNFVHCSSLPTKHDPVHSVHRDPCILRERDVNLSMHKSCFDLIPYFASRPSAQAPRDSIDGGVVVTIQHFASNSFLLVEGDQVQFARMEDTQSAAMWVVQPESIEWAGLPITSGSRLRLRHLTSDSYLMAELPQVRRNASTTALPKLQQSPEATEAEAAQVQSEPVSHFLREETLGTPVREEGDCGVQLTREHRPENTLWTLEMENRDEPDPKLNMPFFLRSNVIQAGAWLSRAPPEISGAELVEERQAGLVTKPVVHDMLTFTRVPEDTARQVAKYSAIRRQLAIILTEISTQLGDASPPKHNVKRWAELAMPLVVGSAAAAVRGKEGQLGVARKALLNLKAAKSKIRLSMANHYEPMMACFREVIQDCVPGYANANCSSLWLPNPTSQRRAREQGLLDCAVHLMQLLFREKGLPYDILLLKPSHLGGDLVGLCKLCHGVVIACCHENADNIAYVAAPKRAWLLLLREQFGSEMRAADTLMVLYANNRQQLERISDGEMSEYINFAVQLQQPKFMHFLATICKQGESPLPTNQNRIVRLLIGPSAKTPITTFLRSELRPEPLTKINRLVVMATIHGKQVSVDAALHDGGKELPEGTARPQDVAMLIYTETLELFSALIYGRNHTARTELYGLRTHMAIGYKDLLTCAFLTSLPKRLRATCVHLLLGMYVDTEPYLADDPVELVRCWKGNGPSSDNASFLSSSAPAGNGRSLASMFQVVRGHPSVADPGFHKLREHILGYLEEIGGALSDDYARSSLTLAVLELTQQLLRQGLFGGLFDEDKPIARLVTHIIRILDGRDDIIEGEGHSRDESARFRQTLEYCFDLRLNHRLALCFEMFQKYSSFFRSNDCRDTDPPLTGTSPSDLMKQLNSELFETTIFGDSVKAPVHLELEKLPYIMEVLLDLTRYENYGCGPSLQRRDCATWRSAVDAEIGA
ncbi:hypothetical protein CYMTET_42485 [Cymbomonas tetramitiformis]|uniref:MIR domain-containing protein n=1 Tax=Cymbomonas tetramitiformis TaxID=36881 RepID=A0AAE0F1H0_9CHLO|nr:hypothetical protein CYMTET_42485 [Cymbomonas tetramitiformis]